tara:strand:+ start:2932 stop:3288 length:357 start_codon:yes stop_codon:yes gene_type:complete
MTDKNVKPIDNITAHFRNKISGTMRSIHVPEWDTTIWFKESNTLEQEGRLIELAQKGKTIEALVETLITKARTEDGKQMFARMDKTVFMHEADPSVVIRVCSEMNNTEDSNVEFAVKN